MSKCALYRHFSADDELLYVGISSNPFDRTSAHNCTAPWFEKVVWIEIEWCKSRDEALWFEATAITQEKPRYNVVGTHQVNGQMKRVRGVNSRKPDVQAAIDALVEEAAGLGHALSRRRCLNVVQEQVLAIKENRAPNI